MDFLAGIDAMDVFELWVIGSCVIAEHEQATASRAPWFQEYGS